MRRAATASPWKRARPILTSVQAPRAGAQHRVCAKQQYQWSQKTEQLIQKVKRLAPNSAVLLTKPGVSTLSSALSLLSEV